MYTRTTICINSNSAVYLTFHNHSNVKHNCLIEIEHLGNFWFYFSQYQSSKTNLKKIINETIPNVRFPTSGAAIECDAAILRAARPRPPPTLLHQLPLLLLVLSDYPLLHQLVAVLREIQALRRPSATARREKILHHVTAARFLALLALTAALPYVETDELIRARVVIAGGARGLHIDNGGSRAARILHLIAGKREVLIHRRFASIGRRRRRINSQIEVQHHRISIHRFYTIHSCICGKKCMREANEGGGMVKKKGIIAAYSICRVIRRRYSKTVYLLVFECEKRNREFGASISLSQRR